VSEKIDTSGITSKMFYPSLVLLLPGLLLLKVVILLYQLNKLLGRSTRHRHLPPPPPPQDAKGPTMATKVVINMATNRNEPI
jgi:hypothetical protein